MVLQHKRRSDRCLRLPQQWTRKPYGDLQLECAYTRRLLGPTIWSSLRRQPRSCNVYTQYQLFRCSIKHILQLRANDLGQCNSFLLCLLGLCLIIVAIVFVRKFDDCVFFDFELVSCSLKLTVVFCCVFRRLFKFVGFKPDQFLG